MRGLLGVKLEEKCPEGLVSVCWRSKRLTKRKFRKTIILKRREGYIWTILTYLSLL
jgi:hypothetical protein